MQKILTLFFTALLVSGCAGNQSIQLPTQFTSQNEQPVPQPHSQTQSKRESVIRKSEIAELGDRSSPQKALVIGNSSYNHKPLDNPYNDAVDMANILANEMGFHVTRATDLNYQEMKTVIGDFRQLLVDTPGSATEKVGLLYYSGHGARSSRNDNYLIPTDNGRIKTEHDLRHKAVGVKQEIVEPLEKTHNGVNIIIADACRDNPYEDSGKSGKRGLARENPPPATPEKLGAVIAFAASDNEVADDGGKRNGLYTGHLLAKMREGKHKLVVDVFMEVYDPVAQESGNTQHPWYESTLAVDYCLGGCTTP